MQNLILSDFQVQQFIRHHSKSKAFLTFVIDVGGELLTDVDLRGVTLPWGDSFQKRPGVAFDCDHVACRLSVRLGGSR